ncbi:MAG TPA: response regulator [Desulfomonilia bacterium]|nr:response regulator [Desulfomonilia bacterium]
MKTLIVEDELTSRIILQRILSPYGEVHLSLNGGEAIDAFKSALDQGSPFDLICMDFMMPELDGRTALVRIRTIETEKGINQADRVKVIMTTGLRNINTEYDDITSLCDAVIQKPVRKDNLTQFLQKIMKISPISL